VYLSSLPIQTNLLCHDVVQAIHMPFHHDVEGKAVAECVLAMSGWPYKFIFLAVVGFVDSAVNVF